MKIALSGYYGYGNLGDEAILEAICGRLSNHRIEVLSAGHRFNLKAIYNCDLFISGGGGLLQDITSAKSFYYYLGLIWLAQRLGKKTCVLSQSLGPIKSTWHRRILKGVLSRVDLLTVRDQNSVDLLKETGLPADKIILTADPAFLLKRDERTKGRKDARKRIGVALRDWRMDDEKMGSISQALERIEKEFEAEIILIPFQWPQDQAIARRFGKFKIAEPCQGTALHKIIDLIAGLDLLIGMRLHSLIFAVITNTPCVGISYDPKVASFMEEIGAPYINLDDLKSADNLVSPMKAGMRIPAFIEAKKSSLIKRAELAFNLVESLLILPLI